MCVEDKHHHPVENTDYTGYALGAKRVMKRHTVPDEGIPKSYIAAKRRGGVEVRIQDDQSMMDNNSAVNAPSSDHESGTFIESEEAVLDLDEIDEFDAQIDEEFEAAKRQHLEYQKHRLEAAKRIQALQRGRKSRDKTLKFPL